MLALPPFVSALAADLLVCLRFWSRLPVPVLKGESDPHGLPDFDRVPRMLPVAGAIIGGVGALAFALARWIGLPSDIAAGLALAAPLIATGAFHEDGLADTADGLGGGASRERKLEIMKDSRIGTFGGAALVLSLGLRWTALSGLDEATGTAATACAIIAVAAVSRMAGLTPAVLLEPARANGAAQAAGRPGSAALAVGVALAVLLSAALILPFWRPDAWLGAGASAVAGAALVSWIARRQIGGQTGDIAGAAQQISEIAFLLALLAAARV